MAALTINLPLNDFKVTEVQDLDYKLLIYGETTETSGLSDSCRGS